MSLSRGGRHHGRRLLLVVLAVLVLLGPGPVAVRPALAAEPTPTLEITWTRPGVAGTMAPPSAVRVGDTVTIATDLSDYSYATCDISFRHAGDQREMWTYFQPQSQADPVECVPWTFTVPPAPKGLIEVRGNVYGDPIDGPGGITLMTPLVELFLDAGGTPQPFASNYPVASWATVDSVGVETPGFNMPLTIRQPPGAATCSYTINGNLQVQFTGIPPTPDGCADWNVTLPDARPAITATGPFAAPWDGWLIIRGSSTDLVPGATVGGVSTTKQLFWTGTGESEFESDFPAAALFESRTPHYVLTGSTVVLDPEIRSVSGVGVCQYGMVGPTTSDTGISVERPLVDGVCEPYSFDTPVAGNYQVGVGVRIGDWYGSSMNTGIWALDPMPAPTIEVEPPEATVPFDVTSSMSGGSPATYEFSLGGGSTASVAAYGPSETGFTALEATAASGACSSGTLDYQANQRTAAGQCTAPSAGTYMLTARFRDVTGAARTRTTTVYVIPPGAGADIVGHPFVNDIRWLYATGITGGCSSTNFCPNLAVSREQMASFLRRALVLPPTPQDFFTDDETSAHEGDINRLAASKITGGCGGTRFCPRSVVTRAQMASFLARALSLPATSVDYFDDDDGSAHEADINRLAAAGITGGCATRRFCPSSSVTRGQMAAFLRRAFD